MKTREEIDREIEKIISEMQEAGDGENWDVRNGWLTALRWVVGE
jgi:hypothetical protein